MVTQWVDDLAILSAVDWPIITKTSSKKSLKAFNSWDDFQQVLNARILKQRFDICVFTAAYHQREIKMFGIWQILFNSKIFALIPTREAGNPWSLDPIILQLEFLWGNWPPAPDPQLGESCPLEQLHILGLEQKPSPQEFLQIAAEKKMRMEGLQLCLFMLSLSPGFCASS